MADAKRIAKNTLFMYFRMILVTLVSLYTSRVILNTLGVEDYGTYQVVGGVVALLAFLNLTLSQGTSRFLMFDLGKGDAVELKNTFSTLLTAHIGLAIVIILVAETIGLWFVKNKLVIAEDRMSAALITYHISILTSFFTLTQTPYTASIKSHEKMGIYAYTAIFDVVAKLAIAFLIGVSPIDRLVFYSVLLCAETIAMIMFYRYYCVKNFEETRYRFFFDKNKFKSIISYSGWNLFSNLSNVANAQGLTIIINMFFNAGVVTAISIATTVKNAANIFVENFIVALVPQVVKSYAQGNYQESKRLLLKGTEFSFYLILTLGIPICLLAPEILRLWLGFIPEYSVIFLRIIMITCIIQVFIYCLFIAIDAAGKIKEYSIWNPVVMIIGLPVTYFVFKQGASPVWGTIIMSVSYFIISFVVLPLLDKKLVGYKLSEIYRVFAKCAAVSVVTVPLPLLFSTYNLFQSDFIKLISVSAVSIVTSAFAIWIIGLDKDTRKLILNKIYKLVGSEK